MKTSSSTLVLFTALVALSFASPTRAQVIYDNLGNGNPFTSASGFVIGTSTGAEVAVRFTAGSSLLLDYADLRLWSFGNMTGSVALLTNGVDNRPAAVLEQVPVSFPPFGVSSTPLTRADFSNTVFLTAGTLYWLAVSPIDTTVLAGWDNTGLPFGSLVQDTGAIGAADPWATVLGGSREAGMRIFGAPAAVPEASTYGLVASVLLISFAALRYRMKSA